MIHPNIEKLISLSAVVVKHYNNDLDERLSLVPTYILVRWSLLRFVGIGRLGIGLDYKTSTQINQSNIHPMKSSKERQTDR